MMQAEACRVSLPLEQGEIHVTLQGDAEAPAVFMAHSILSDSTMWDEQAALLASHGWRVVRADFRGHGSSVANKAPANMDELMQDTITVLDALHLETVDYVGLSLGGMVGFGLGARHGHRLRSLLLCDARADAPANVAAPWDTRIEEATHGGCEVLADATIERWFGSTFVQRQPGVAGRMREIAARTSVKGFAGCARAIQQLDYIGALSEITTRCTLLVGARDGGLPEVNRALQQAIRGSSLVMIPDAGHLPNIDQPAAFNAALLLHLTQES